MRSRYVLSLLFLAGLFALAGSAHAGAPGSGGRQMFLPQVCKGGPNVGMTCSADTDCPNSKCEVNYLNGPGTNVPLEVCIIVDDNVSTYDESETIPDVVAVTALATVKYKGKTHFLAQTYQNLNSTMLDPLIGHPNNLPMPPGCNPAPADPLAILTCNLQAGPEIADSAESDKLVREFRLSEAITDDPSITILDDFLWQNGDGDLADALRAIVGVTGKPVVAETPRKVRSVQYSNHEADGLASVACLDVRVRFVPEP